MNAGEGKREGKEEEERTLVARASWNLISGVASNKKLSCASESTKPTQLTILQTADKR